MPYLYICRQCRTQAPTRKDRRQDAEDDQQQHRDAVHGGHMPLDGDGIEHVHADSRGDGLLPRHTLLAVMVLLLLILANCWGR
ncbi:hypothetical protein [Streptomyces sp. YIM S03343]